MNATITTPGSATLYTLSTITTRDHAGRHFTEVFPDDHLDALESAGLIEVSRPVHEPTGIPWDRSHWSVEITEAGLEAVVDYFNEDDYPDED